jgi:hypothetical protein
MEFKHTAIIIEPRKHMALEFVLNNMLDCLSCEWKVILFHGINNEEYSKEIFGRLNEIYPNRLQLVKLDIVNLNTKTYSELLATKYDVYNYIHTEYFLIFQTDSMMFKENAHFMEEFLNHDYDYVGAPWLICNYPPTRERGFIGNGGFSLRKKSTMMKILERREWDENGLWEEDLYFTRNYEGIELKKPDYEKAKKFCVDEVYEYPTMSCHKVWCHLHMKELMIKHQELEYLINLQKEKE